MFFMGLGTATPANCFTQKQCYAAVEQSSMFENLDARSRALLRKVLLGANGIETRHLALDDLSQGFDTQPDTLHSRFARHAPRLAAESACRALANAGLEPREVDALLISTCTGYLCPGLTSWVSELLELRRDALCLDLVGQGCGAAIPNLRSAEALLESKRADRVLSICVEVCSAAAFFDSDPGVLISACLFGDGAAAAVLGREAGPGRPVRWIRAETTLATADRELLRFQQAGGRLRNILSPLVPQQAARHAGELMRRLMSNASLRAADVTAWILHPGGRDVLRALSREIQLDEEQLATSASILRRYGNLSSPSVLFVLQELLTAGAPGGYWYMSTFGAGFACHGAILHADQP